MERASGKRLLVIFGAGHVGRSVALLGAVLGMNVVLVDDRKDFLRLDLLPVSGIQFVLSGFDNIESQDIVDEGSEIAVVIVTRGHQSDEVILRQVLKYRLGYLGMIGSKRRIAGVLRRLRSEGISELLLGSVRAPIGLDIGAASPQEIAVAIHAEIISHFNKALVCRKQ